MTKLVGARPQPNAPVAITAALHVPDLRTPHEGPCTDSHLLQSRPHVGHLMVDLPRSAVTRQGICLRHLPPIESQACTLMPRAAVVAIM
jgi:hypothetical protein